MNRAFKIQFHNGEKDEKTIVTMSFSVNNGKRFKDLDYDGKLNLLTNIQRFKEMVNGFTDEVKESLGDKP